jgi:hypothetical protein
MSRLENTIANRTVLVTGANRGIGRALVDEALRRGAKRVYAGTRQPLAHPDGRVTTLILDGPRGARAAVHRSTQRITELIPGKRVAWHVLDGYLNFVDNPTEWTGNDITFDIAPTDDGTQVRFTHVGLAPDQKCFESCSSAWRYYIATTSLPSLINDGAGHPNPKEDNAS